MQKIFNGMLLSDEFEIESTNTIELIGAGASVEVLPVVKGKEFSALS